MIAPSVMTKGYGGGMADQEDWTPGDVASMVANPFYAINIDEGLALPHEPLIDIDCIERVGHHAGDVAGSPVLLIGHAATVVL